MKREPIRVQLDEMARTIYETTPHPLGVEHLRRELQGHAECLETAQRAKPRAVRWHEWLAFHTAWEKTAKSERITPLVMMVMVSGEVLLAANIRALEEEQALSAKWAQRVEDLAAEVDRLRGLLQDTKP